MFSRVVFALWAAGAAMACPATALAQQWPAPPPPAKNMDRLPARTPAITPPEVEELTPSQIKRAQDPEPPPPLPAAAPKKPEEVTKHAPKPSGHTYAIACEGTFAKTSSQVKLESIYKPQNVAFTQVDGPDGTKVMATVLFPKNPKQRLEVWWSDEEKHKDIYLIVINGKSVWAVPGGVKLGLNLTALEKINQKPFKLKGLDKDNGSQVSDWNDGALAQLPGGCRVGVRLRPASSAAAKLREAAAGNKEFASSDAAIRALKPSISEIILGY